MGRQPCRQRVIAQQCQEKRIGRTYHITHSNIIAKHGSKRLLSYISILPGVNQINNNKPSHTIHPPKSHQGGILIRTPSQKQNSRQIKKPLFTRKKTASFSPLFITLSRPILLRSFSSTETQISRPLVPVVELPVRWCEVRCLFCWRLSSCGVLTF